MTNVMYRDSFMGLIDPVSEFFENDSEDSIFVVINEVEKWCKENIVDMLVEDIESALSENHRGSENTKNTDAFLATFEKNKTSSISRSLSGQIIPNLFMTG